MRFVILGAGAIGGVLGARLHQAGYEVALIARGAHHDAIRDRGLTLEDPDSRTVLEIPVFDAPGTLPWGLDDVVLLATKSQDSIGALLALRAVAPPHTPIFCVQNGVENERLALRLFANVYGAVVMAPTAHLEPGVVQAYGGFLTGIIDIGRYPSGADERCREVADAFGASRFSSQARPDVMRFKYAKLIANLANAVEAMCVPGEGNEELVARAREEGAAVLRAAGIEFLADEVDDVRARWERLDVREISGHQRGGSSTWQSLARGTASVETDYLNGEIVLLGRLQGVPTPVNALLDRLSERLARDGGEPARLPAAEVLEQLWTR
jgi:2-dehydropantoate 2-reductase